MSEIKEWTLMFYFASDNALAHEIVSQLKSIKNAGYHHEVNVIAYFDPQPAGTPAHIFDVNAIYKLKHPYDNDIGFASDDPFVRNLIDDRLWGREKDRNEKIIRQRIIDQLKEKEGITYTLPPVTRDTADNDNGEKSLRSFLDFCAFAYPAKHYMLFILGHGLVVGDDVFLLDEHAAKRSVTLRELGDALTDFKAKIGEAQFELVGFHSCSMSSLEVAFQLQDTANYMLASQGPAFVGSWPYRQILIRVFKDVAEGKFNCPGHVKANVKKMLGKIFKYVYFNSKDYLLAGYSFDLCLCDLRKDKIKTLEKPIKDLSKALVAGLNDKANPLVSYAILLAHWKSQSYFQENYTDLYDFCFCLDGYCTDFVKAVKAVKAVNDASACPFQKIQTACHAVIQVLTNQESDQSDHPVNSDNAVHSDTAVDSDHPANSNKPVIRAIFAGPDSQFSHGLSVYFPWARPMADRKIIKEYKEYYFNQTKWFDFLDQYWGPQDADDVDRDVAASTMRNSRKTEVNHALSAANADANNESAEAMLNEDIASLMFNVEGPLNVNGTLTKPNPQGTTGDECTCGSIKNFPRDTRARRERGKSATKKTTYPVNQTTTGI